MLFRSAYDLQQMHVAEQKAYNNPIGRSVTWRNPTTQNGTTVTPIRQDQQPDGTWCRQFHLVVYENGGSREGYGSACQMPNGGWRALSSIDTPYVVGSIDTLVTPSESGIRRLG